MKAHRLLAASTLVYCTVAAFACETPVEGIGSAYLALSSDTDRNDEICPDVPSQAMLGARDWSPLAPHRGAPEIQSEPTCAGIAAGTICSYPKSDGWKAFICGCFEDDVWAAYSETRDDGCPAERPVYGESCSDVGLCAYAPGWVVECNRGAWNYQQIASRGACTNLSTELRDTLPYPFDEGVVDTRIPPRP
jgi:hypothetical protein